MRTLYQQKLPMGEFVVLDQRPDFAVASLQQIHSSLLVDLRNDQLTFPIAIAADGMIASISHTLPLAIVTADCLPIAVAGKKAVALIHAGWRGLWQEILASPLLAAIQPYYFFIGPHIRPCCYQVGEEFLQYFPQQLPKTGPWYLDLAMVAQSQIYQLYPHAQTEKASPCTCCHPTNFHSFRRTKNDCRNWNLLLPSA